MNNKMIIVMFLFFIVLAVLGGYSLIDSKEEVKVKTGFGCLVVEDKYTDLEWEAKQDLINNLKLQSSAERCD